ncbi:hypothetical protein ACFCVO_15855 [Agromyces sp. NPDC056379]|uniref:hypothetical protein n=1 Tax=unclassified Agromyces TaxID=2639701 RepID=UPI0035D74D3B
MNRLDRMNHALRRYDEHAATAEATLEELRPLISACADLTERIQAAIRLLFPQDLTPGGRSILERVVNGDTGPTRTEALDRP